MRRLAVVFAVLASLAACGQAVAATYYVSSAGSDSNAGTSAASAWRTINKVNYAHLAPGDVVLFQGGSTFNDTTLMPAQSGTAGNPVTFSSYGGGRATLSNADGAVWFSGKSYLTFDNLDLTSGGAASGIFAGSPGGGSDHIVLRNSVVHDGAGTGVSSPSHADSDWTIENDIFRNLGDSGLILLGANFVVRGNTISQIGVNAAITYGKHGIYAKGPDMTIVNNDISNVTGGQAVSIRFHGARIYGNTIHDTPYGFAFFDYDPAPAPQGTSYIYANRLWNITGYGFYYDNYTDNGVPPSVDFVVASNTFSFSSASEAVNVSPSGSAHVTVANNIFTGTYTSAYRGASTSVENHNNWSGASSNIPHNAGDTTSAPGLGAAPGFALQSGSPLADAGVALSGLSYSSSCDGSPLSYCGSAPDLGAVESAPAIVLPLAPPTALAATNVTGTSLTLGWTASGDARTIGYRVSQNGTVIATPTGTSLAVSSLSCGTSYSFTVLAVDVTSATSIAATASASTAACAAPVPPPSGGGGGGGGGPVPVPAPTPAPVPAPAPVPVPDKTPPTLALTSPSANATVPLTFAIAANATDAGGVARVTFSVDGVTRCTATAAPYGCAVSVKNGWHTITVKAFDRAGNTAAKTVSVRALASARRIASVLAASPASGTHVAKSFVVHAQAVAPKGRAVVFELDGHARCVDRVAPYSCTLHATSGWHVVAVRAGSARALNLQLHVR